MRRTDRDIRHRLTDLMRSASVLLLSTLTVLAVVSCSGGGDDVGTTPQPGPVGPDEPDNNVAILFSASQQQETDVTRAESPLESKVKSFIVYGYKNSGTDYSGVQKVFPGYIVKWAKDTENTTTTNTDGWEYVNQQPDDGVTPEQTIKYWDMSASAYRFFGVAQGEGDYQTEEILDGGQPKEFKISFNLDATSEAGVNAAPYFSKLWYSTGVLPEYNDREFGKPVKLLFLKPFARVRFMFTQSDPKAVLMLENKSFGPKSGATIVDKCRLTVIYPLKGTAKEESYEMTGPDPEEVTDPPTVTVPQGVTAFTEDYSETDQRWYNVYAPQNLGVFTLTVTVNGSIKEVNVPAEYMNWEPGYQYTYVFKITDMGGVEIDLVESAFSAWYEIQGNTEIHNW